jgi:hypothetical protein
MSLDLRNREDSRTGRIVTNTFWGRVRYVVVAASATLAARRMLAKTLRPYKSRGSPAIPPHLLQDIGLPPDPYRSLPTHWDYR